MSKSSKKKRHPEKERKASQAAAVVEPAGRLVAIEGAAGHDLEAEAQRLARIGGRGNDAIGWSCFDASNTFYELRLRKSKHLTPTPRTLLLLYVSDLLFRLRWEIRPALAEGRTVIAAPYVETAVGFGVAAGLPQDWLRELFRFAPRPEARFRLKEKGKLREKEKNPKAAPGFVEFCCASLTAASGDWNAAAIRRGLLRHLDDLEGKGEIRKIGKKLPKALTGKAHAAITAAH
jgi:hypothetical protein